MLKLIVPNGQYNKEEDTAMNYDNIIIGFGKGGKTLAKKFAEKNKLYY